MMNAYTRSAAGCLSRCMQLLALLVLAPAITKSELTGGYMTSTYSCNWTYDQPTDTISFVIHATQGPNTWTAVAFSPTPNMENQDTIYGYVELEVGHVVDAYVGSRFSPPVADTMSNIHDASVQYVGGVLTMMFQRPRVSPDTAQDVSFTDTPTLYFKFPDGGGPMSGSTILKHTKTPIISQQMICIGPCGATTMAQPSTNQAMSSAMTMSMGPSTAGPAMSPTTAASGGGSSSPQSGMSSTTKWTISSPGRMSSSAQGGMSSSAQGGMSSSTHGGMSSPGGMSSDTQGGMSSSTKGGMSSGTQGGMSSPSTILRSGTQGGMSSPGGMSSGTQGGMSSQSTLLISGTQGGMSSPGGMSSSTQGGMSSHGGMGSPGGMSSQSGMTGQPGGSTESSSKGSNNVLLATIIASVVVFSVLVVLIFCVCCFC